MKRDLYLRCLFICGLLSAASGGFAQTVTADKNAVVHYRARIGTTDPNALTNNYQNAAAVIEYLDGLGRPIQTVGYRATPQANDLMQQAIQYDNFGRPVQTYLPAPATANSGGYQPNPQALGQEFYADTHPFDRVKEFENSPLNRPKQTYGAGQAWQTNGKYKEMFYETAGDDVRYYVKAGDGSINQSGNYPANSLFKVRMVDEQGHTIIEIKDKQGRLVQQQVQDESGFMTTHYVYDGLDRLLAIIQPKGYEGGTNFSYDGTEYRNYVFAYEYDVRGRVSKKHVPGGGWTSYVYDKADRPVLTQSALQGTVAQWSFIKYDPFGRTIISGELVNSNSRASLQNLFDGVAVPYETWNGSGYTTQSFPVSYNASDVRQTNYYDTYDWRPIELKYESNGAYNSTAQYDDARGLMTGSEVRSNENIGINFKNVMYYDTKGRTVQTYQTHHKGGSNLNANPIRTDYEYNFAGEVTKQKVSHKIDGLATTDVLTVNEYDHVGRTLKVFHGINGAAVQELCRYTYDEIGRMSQKKILPNGTYLYGGIPDYIARPPNPNVGIDDIAKKAVTLLPGTEITNLYLAAIDPNAANGVTINGLQTIDYSYHIRGMLRGMNLDNNGNAVPNTVQGDLFSYKLDYETAPTVQWDGNIGKQTWKNDTEGQRNYTYGYDAAKRLKSATYAGINGENFSLPNMSYDKNGNIGNLQRNGKVGAGFGPVDNLQYNYSGNRLTSVSDNAGGGDHEVDFVPRGNGSYTYWDDGSLRSDANEGIDNIFYDTYLMQPTEVFLTGGRRIKNFYDGSGHLFKVLYYDNTNTVIETWEYVGMLVFKNGQFYQMATPDGRATYNVPATQWEYEFFYQDHLGNTRVSFKAEGNQLVKTAETAFDPWGVRLNGIGSVNGFQNRWEMQGKEKESTFGLNRINFGARTYNPTIGRWDRGDSYSEKYYSYSPYNYVLNNPINLFDPDGNFPYPITIRSFAPIGSFKGTGFGDDGRSFSTSSRVTSRISQTFIVDPSAKSIRGGKPVSSPTTIGSFSKTATDEGRANATFFQNKAGSIANVSSEFEGSNPFFFGIAPNIAVSSDITLTENIQEGTLGVSINLSSKQFPATEAIIQDSKNQSVFLGGAAAFGNAGNLVTANKKPISNVNLTIGIDKNGVFQNVTIGGKTYSIADFNSTFTPKSAGPYQRENKDK